MITKKNLICIIFLFIFLFLPHFVAANYFTLPVDVNPNTKISAWFDHDGNASTSMSKYTGTIYTGSAADLSTCSIFPNDGSGCYDDHNGTDFATSTGAHILAPADGVVHEIYWNNEGGWTMRIWHGSIGLSTFYAHIATTTMATTSDPVSRGQYIADVNTTGNSTGPHLHFGVSDGDSQSSHRLDPFGWWATTTDPWSYDQGYLWTTDPPSFNLNSTTTSNITSTTTWRGNMVVNGDISESSGVNFSIDPGTIVKFETNSKLTVNGNLNAIGSSTKPIYFTSYKDDSVGGDTNYDGTSTSPAAGDWCGMKIGSSGSSTLSNVFIGYGGYNNCASSIYSNLFNNGGILNISNSTIATSSNYGLRMDSGTTTASNVETKNNSYGLYFTGGVMNFDGGEIHHNSQYGVSTDNDSANLSVDDTDFANNTNGSGYIYNSVNFSHSNNSVSGSGPQGFSMNNNVSYDRTWNADNIPYVLRGSVSIDSGKKLTVEPGAIIKTDAGSYHFSVNGELDMEGNDASPIYFTSYKDDSIGGDTNGDGTSTSPSGNDWCDIKINSGASSTISYSVFGYGGSSNCSGASRANIYNNGGILTISNSRIATSSVNGIRIDSGTTTVSNSEINNNMYGFYLYGGVTNTASSSIYGNSSYGMYNSAVSTTTAENNYWGSSSGPYHPTLNPSGTGNAVSNHVDFIPWLNNWP